MMKTKSCNKVVTLMCRHLREVSQTTTTFNKFCSISRILYSLNYILVLSIMSTLTSPRNQNVKITTLVTFNPIKKIVINFLFKHSMMSEFIWLPILGSIQRNSWIKQLCLTKRLMSSSIIRNHCLLNKPIKYQPIWPNNTRVDLRNYALERNWCTRSGKMEKFWITYLMSTSKQNNQSLTGITKTISREFNLNSTSSSQSQHKFNLNKS